MAQRHSFKYTNITLQVTDTGFVVYNEKGKWILDASMLEVYDHLRICTSKEYTSFVKGRSDYKTETKYELANFCGICHKRIPLSEKYCGTKCNDKALIKDI